MEPPLLRKDHNAILEFRDDLMRYRKECDSHMVRGPNAVIMDWKRKRDIDEIPYPVVCAIIFIFVSSRHLLPLKKEKIEPCSMDGEMARRFIDRRRMKSRRREEKMFREWMNKDRSSGGLKSRRELCEFCGENSSVCMCGTFDPHF